MNPTPTKGVVDQQSLVCRIYSTGVSILRPSSNLFAHSLDPSVGVADGPVHGPHELIVDTTLCPNDVLLFQLLGLISLEAIPLLRDGRRLLCQLLAIALQQCLCPYSGAETLMLTLRVHVPK